jgi:hypothetical protein
MNEKRRRGRPAKSFGDRDTWKQVAVAVTLLRHPHHAYRKDAVWAAIGPDAAREDFERVSRALREFLNPSGRTPWGRSFERPITFDPDDVERASAFIKRRKRAVKCLACV